jgi:hypothetical protein
MKNETRKEQSNGRRSRMTGRTHRRRRTGWPSTTMADAFLVALGKWISLHPGNDSAVVVLTQFDRKLIALPRLWVPGTATSPPYQNKKETVNDNET